MQVLFSIKQPYGDSLSRSEDVSMRSIVNAASTVGAVKASSATKLNLWVGDENMQSLTEIVPIDSSC